MSLRVDSPSLDPVRSVPDMLAAFNRYMPQIEGILRQLISEGNRLDAAIVPRAATAANPKFTGPLEVKTLETDPGNPPAGKSWVFVLGGNIVVRKNSGSVVTEWVGTLT